MIDGLKLTMTGDELISLIDARIARIRDIIGIKQDAIDGKAPVPRTPWRCQVPAETVEEEIRQHEYRIRTLTIVRDHVVQTETYLIGKADLEFGELLPDPPPSSSGEWDISNEIRWVDHPVDVTGASATSGCPGE